MNRISLEESPLSIVIFLLTIGISLYTIYGKKELFDKLALHPWSIVHDNKYYQFLTSGFIHADVMHLMFNMLTFYFFAFELEKFIGTWRFALIYFASLIFSDVSTVFKQKDNQKYYAVGASGAISGILFSYILFSPTSKIGMFFIPIGIPAPLFALLYLAFCFYASKKSSDLINHEAHFWGALTGLLVTIALVPEVLLYFFHSIF
ncbi:MAG: rhomboid family intramembrane serine protease [Bacteroidota bacterium]